MDINQAIQQIVGTAQTAAQNVPVPTVQSLSLSLPSYQDMDTQFKGFLDKASKDPGIVKYYQDLLQKANNDFELAKTYLEADYQTGVRQTTDNLRATLQSLGISQETEQNTLADTLNKRGIAMTDMGQGQNPQYAAGGQAGTEHSNLIDTQKLRTEAETRSAQQNIQNMGLSKQEKLSSLGQGYQSTVQNLQNQQQTDVKSEAMGSYNTQQNENQAKITSANQNASNPTTSTTNGPLSNEKRMADYTATGGKGDLPVGFEA